MNHDKMLALANFIEGDTLFFDYEDDQLRDLPEGTSRWTKLRFSMVSYAIERTTEGGHVCGSCACIAGSAVYMEDREKYTRMASGKDSRDFFEMAKEYLGLTPFQANMLFVEDFTDKWTAGFARDLGLRVDAIYNDDETFDGFGFRGITPVMAAAELRRLVTEDKARAGTEAE